jgi:hypothetical protein
LADAEDERQSLGKYLFSRLHRSKYESVKIPHR